MTTSERLMGYGVRPSVQRVLIYEYLLEHRTHPNVEEIYESLAPQMPTLSKTTIYNTLKLFGEKGVILVLNIDEKMQRFDAYTHEHTHFLCNRCGKVYDFPHPKLERPQLGEGFELKSIEISYRGICGDCSQKLSTSL